MRWLRCADGVLRDVDRFKRRYALFGFPYAVWRKYCDDSGAMLAALLTYYGFLSVFPLLLLAVTLITDVLAAQPALRHELVEELVPEWLRSDVERAFQELPPSGVPLFIGVVGWSALAAPGQRASGRSGEVSSATGEPPDAARVAAATRAATRFR